MKILRIVLWTIGVVIALVAAVVAAVTLTAPGRDRLASVISDLASTEDRTVSIEGLDGIWSGYLRVDGVVVGDRDGIWLTAENLAIDWSPRALLSGLFQADRVAAERIEIARAPLAAEVEPAPQDDTPFSLPVDIRVDQVDVPQIVLGEALAGTAASLGLAGSVSADGQPFKLDTTLRATRTDGVAGTLEAVLAFVPEENRLNIEVDASEPAGGIVAGLLGLAGEPAVDIEITGSGPAADWSGQGTVSLDGAVVTRLSGRHRLTAEGSAIEAQGDGDFESFVPEIAKPLVAGNTMFDIAATILPENAGIRISGAVLESEAVRLSANGSIDSAGQNDLRLDVAARAGSVPFLIGEGTDAVRIAVDSVVATITGPGATPSLSVAADLASVDAPQVRTGPVSVTATSPSFDTASLTGPVALSLTANGVEQDDPTLQPLLAGPIAVAAQTQIAAESINIETGTIDGGALDGTVSGTISRADGSLDLVVSADVLASALPEAARPAFGERASLSAGIARAADGTLSLRDIDLSSGGLSVAGSASLADGTVDAAITGGFADIAPLGQDASGPVAFSLNAEGPVSAPQVALTVTSDRVTAAGRPIAALDLRASGTVDLANPAAEVSITANVDGQALDGRAVLSTREGERRIEGLSIALGDNRIVGDLILDEGFVPEGSLDIDLPDIGPLAALALQEATGAVNGTIRFARENGEPRVVVDATVPSLVRGDLRATGVAIDATVTDYLASPGITGTVRANEVRSGETIVTGIEVDLAQDGPWTGFDASATVTDIPVAARGRVQLADGTTTVELAEANATVRGIAARLAGPGTVRIVDGTVVLEGIALDVGGGRATIAGSAGSALDLDIDLAGVPAPTVNAFAPGLGAEGTISGQVGVTGPASAPQASFDINWANAATSQTRAAGFGALSIGAQGRYTGSGVTIDVDAGDGSGLALDGGGTIGLGAQQSLNLAFNGRVPFSFLARQLAEQGLALDGAADLDLRVSGSTASPSIAGTVRTSGARFVDAGSGIAVQDMAATISIAGQTATLQSFTGSLSTGGSITGSGTVGIDPAQGFPADLDIAVTEGRYTDGRTVTANFGGNLEVNGPLVSAPSLSGTINLGRTVITVPERLPGTLARIDVQHRNATAAVQRQAEALRPVSGSGGGGGLVLDLEVNAPQEIFVRGRGIDAELGGSIRLTGPVSSPVASGLFTMRRGRLSILGKRLDFARGTIGFAGSLVPALDFAATTAGTNSTTVTVAVSGSANDPTFSFSSSPVLPEDEVLAQLIFGRSMSNLSPLQIAQLAEAAAQLAGIGGNTSLLESLRSTLGVDDLDVKTDEVTGDTSVSVGRYLNDRTYLSIEKGSNAGSGKARIDLEIGRGVKLRGEAADDGATKGGIFYEREY